MQPLKIALLGFSRESAVAGFEQLVISNMEDIESYRIGSGFEYAYFKDGNIIVWHNPVAGKEFAG